MEMCRASSEDWCTLESVLRLPQSVHTAYGEFQGPAILVRRVTISK